LEQFSPGPTNAQREQDVTVFLVEDDEAARHSLSASLDALGFRVRSFASCEAFLERPCKLARGCLLLDYHFDGMNGLDLVRRMINAGTPMPTILFSGRFGGVLRKMASKIPGVVAVLDKPLDGRDLLEALRLCAFTFVDRR
jgi:two-component system response regulator FixJ